MASNILEVITKGRREVRAPLEPHFLICRMSGKEYQRRLSEAHSGGLKKKKVLLFFADILHLVGKAVCLYFRQPCGESKNLCMHLIKTQINIQAPEDQESSSGKQEYCNSPHIHLFHTQMLVHKYLT